MFTTLAHETAHATLYGQVCRSETTKPLREAETDAVPLVICTGISHGASTAAQDHIDLYDDHAKLLRESLEYVPWTSTQVLQSIDGETSSSQPK